MNVDFKIFLSIAFLLIHQMKKPQQNSVPKTIIKGSGFISTDFSFLKGKGEPQILLLDPNSTVIGFRNRPYLIYATSKLNYQSLPINIRESIDNVKMLVLQSSFSNEIKSENDFKAIPDWINNLKSIEYLRLDDIDIDQLNKLKTLPIHHLILINVKYSNEVLLIKSLMKLKGIRYLAYDNSVSSQTISLINQKIKGISTIYESQYYEEKLDEKL
jgi:hypothetical protein